MLKIAYKIMDSDRSTRWNAAWHLCQRLFRTVHPLSLGRLSTQVQSTDFRRGASPCNAHKRQGMYLKIRTLYNWLPISITCVLCDRSDWYAIIHAFSVILCVLCVMPKIPCSALFFVCSDILYTRPAQNFRGLNFQTPLLRLAQNTSVYQVSGS